MTAPHAPRPDFSGFPHPPNAATATACPIVPTARVAERGRSGTRAAALVARFKFLISLCRVAFALLILCGCGSQTPLGGGGSPIDGEPDSTTGNTSSEGVLPQSPNSSEQPPLADESGSTVDPLLVIDPRYARGPRLPLWSLKNARMLHTDAQIADARQLCQTNAAAAALRNRIVQAAAYWVAIPDEELFWRLPDSRVSRAFNVSTQECPVHGPAVYQYGTYPWILNIEDPFTIECPIGHEKYPSNDFAAYYASGLTDPSLLTGPYADDGRGWVSPSGEKYWMVGYACHWNWRSNWLPAVTKLSQAYAVTGDPRYARKTLVMLDRIAQVYPEMDYATQSRMGELTGGDYKGKILNLLWETRTLLDLAVAYDLVFDAVVGPQAISLPWRTAEDVRANIEANFLEEALQAVAEGKIVGNPSARATAAIVRQGSALEEQLNDILNHSGDGILLDGLNYALHNSVAKDGMPWLTSPIYGADYVDFLASLGRSLMPAGVDIYQFPRMQTLFDLPLGIICTTRFTPSEGDSGGPHTRLAVPGNAAYEDAYRHLAKPSYAWLLRENGAFAAGEYQTFERLFQQPIAEQAQADAASHQPEQGSRVFDGFGMAVLNNACDTAGVSLFYGVRAVHGHYDRLNIELYGHGRRLSPDLGYPDFMNEYVSGVYSWSKNTISHNTVMVDESKQQGNSTGHVLRFHQGESVHVVDVAAAGSYPQAASYRRSLVLVDVGSEDAYLVDVFRVQGGENHVLSLHGAAGDFDLSGAALPPPVTVGTLAGADVEYGELYDDPVLSQPGYAGSYFNYNGSGYSHLFNWQSVTPASLVTARWVFPDEPDLPGAQLRVHVPPQAGQEVVVADAYVSPLRRTPTVLKYMLLRRTAGAAGSTFVVVWELAASPLIDEVTLNEDPALGDGADRIVVLTIRRGGTTEFLSVSPQSGVLHALAGGLSSDAAVSFAGKENGVWDRCLVAGGTFFAAVNPPLTLLVPPTVRGEVVAVDYAAKRITVELEEGGADPAGLLGLAVRIHNSDHASLYKVSAADRNDSLLTLTLTGSDVFTGKARLTQVVEDQRRVTTDTGLPYPLNLVGMTLLTDDLAHAARIQAVTSSRHFSLPAETDMSPFIRDLAAGKDVWVVDFGVGDRIEIERSAR